MGLRFRLQVKFPGDMLAFRGHTHTETHTYPLADLFLECGKWGGQDYINCSFSFSLARGAAADRQMRLFKGLTASSGPKRTRTSWPMMDVFYLRVQSPVSLMDSLAVGHRQRLSPLWEMRCLRHRSTHKGLWVSAGLLKNSLSFSAMKITVANGGSCALVSREQMTLAVAAAAASATSLVASPARRLMCLQTGHLLMLVWPPPG